MITMSTVIWLTDWPAEGYQDVAKMHLKELSEFYRAHSQSISKTNDLSMHTASGHGALSRSCEIDPNASQKDLVVQQAIRMHKDISEGIQTYIQETGHYISITPRSFVNFI